MIYDGDKLEIVIRLLMSINTWLYQTSRGRLSSRMAGYSILLLHTIGCKSGIAYTIPLTYFLDGENYILIASNWGRQNNPGWYHNLIHQPAASIQVKEKTIPVIAHLANGEEYTRLWKNITVRNNFYSHYQNKTKRKIPLVILVPDRK